MQLAIIMHPSVLVAYWYVIYILFMPFPVPLIHCMKERNKEILTYLQLNIHSMQSAAPCHPPTSPPPSAHLLHRRQSYTSASDDVGSCSVSTCQSSNQAACHGEENTMIQELDII